MCLSVSISFLSLEMKEMSHKVIFLQVMLNGNRSSDDHGIKTWEWTKEKGPDGKELPADISGARTPFMTASNLEEVT